MNWHVAIPSSSQSRAHRIDFSRFAGHGIDEVVKAMVHSLQEDVRQQVRSTATVNTMASEAIASFLPWLTAAGTLLERPLRLTDIDRGLLESFTADLRIKHTYSTANTKFTMATMIVDSMSKLGYLPPYAEIVPKNQFPGASSAQNPTQPYSTRERDELLRALAIDFRGIKEGTHPTISAGSVDSLAIGLLLLAMPTGFNLTPLLELGRDALHPHPLHKNEWLLVAYKRRGHKEVTATAKWSDRIAEMHSLDLHLVPIYKELLRWTERDASKALKTHRNTLFIRPPLLRSKKPTPVPLTALDFLLAIAKLNKRYDVKADDGKRLRISTRRIRSTLAARIYQLSGGDPFVVAKVLGNLPRTTSLHYLEPELDAPVKFAQAVKRFAQRLTESKGHKSTLTAVGGCSDPLHGRFAPKDGITYCQRWLHCFSCPNQCITGDEKALWRLYSFYWLLQAKLQRLRRMAVSGQVRFVLHVIDVVVTERFGQRAIRAKAKARENPHPLWASAKAIDALFLEAPDAGTS